MRQLIALLVTTMASSTCLGGEAVKANYAVWTASSLVKVLKSDRVRPLARPDEPLARPDEPTEAQSISAARNERESFQIVLRAGRTPLEDVQIVTHDLSAPRGRISGSNVKAYMQASIYLPRMSASYPDPLPPYRGPFTVNPGQTQALWIDVYVPKSARPGDYKGRVTISPANGEVTVVPFNLHVYNFTLPDESKLATAFGLTAAHVAQQHGVAEGSPEARALHRKYYELLLDRGVSTYEIPADIFSDEGERYLKDPRMTSFVVPYTKDEKEQRRILDRVRSVGAWEKGFFYFLDEPVNQDAYNSLKEGCDYLRKIDPKVNIISPYFRGPAFDEKKTIYELLAGYIDIWCFNTGFFDEKALEARRAAGDTIWNYVCCGPGKPYANFFVEYAPLEHRMLFWQNYLYKVSGLLYWNTTWWNAASTKDPWEDIATVKDINPQLYGDGSLLYPGKKIGVDGPVSSIRLEVIRDGLEDYKYLWLLEQRSGRDAVMPYVHKLAQTWTEYEHDPVQFAAVRHKLAQDIEAQYP